jgi:hypothetical protein
MRSRSRKKSEFLSHERKLLRNHLFEHLSASVCSAAAAVSVQTSAAAAAALAKARADAAVERRSSAELRGKIDTARGPGREEEAVVPAVPSPVVVHSRRAPAVGRAAQARQGVQEATLRRQRVDVDRTTAMTARWCDDQQSHCGTYHVQKAYARSDSDSAQPRSGVDHNRVGPVQDGAPQALRTGRASSCAGTTRSPTVQAMHTDG